MAQSCVCVHQAVQRISCGGFHFLLQGTQTVFHINDMLFCGDKFFVNGMVSVDILVLGKISDIFVFGKNHISGVR